MLCSGRNRRRERRCALFGERSHAGPGLRLPTLGRRDEGERTASDWSSLIGPSRRHSWRNLKSHRERLPDEAPSPSTQFNKPLLKREMPFRFRQPRELRHLGACSPPMASGSMPCIPLVGDSPTSRPAEVPGDQLAVSLIFLPVDLQQELLFCEDHGMKHADPQGNPAQRTP